MLCPYDCLIRLVLCDRPYIAKPVLEEQAPSKRSFEATALCAVGQQGALRDRQNK
ncbi:MAG: hypothetical protein KME32_06090 [Mojavia pulchra JT2-VF2]|uniref:Uncharacterized protein n=1 Tax=Mojavia pulchra JT2-VF2 TaxID=287848 RepID=A0A951PXH4_9NOST|nr:hypothetical protein [Mojavia pulchra JT2-VF2]